MGCFRTVFDASGAGYQFKTGDDGIEEYRVGDAVRDISDAVYDALGEENCAFVFIKSGKVADLLVFDRGPDWLGVRDDDWQEETKATVLSRAKELGIGDMDIHIY